ncbi:uncharacterized, partial [Tachysurus ichikawai]
MSYSHPMALINTLPLALDRGLFQRFRAMQVEAKAKFLSLRVKAAQEHKKVK